jgi:hypothetical protein
MRELDHKENVLTVRQEVIEPAAWPFFSTLLVYRHPLFQILLVLTDRLMKVKPAVLGL